VVTTERTFDLFADFHQFIVCDRDADWSSVADRWTEGSVEAMFVQSDDYIAVGTARNMPVPVTIRILDQEPQRPENECDRVVRGRLNLPSGQVVVTGVTDNGATGGSLPVKPGPYDVRVLYAGLQTISADGLSGADKYTVVLWPSKRD